MKCAVTVKSVTHLVEVGMAQTIVDEIKRLESENAQLKAEVERLQELYDESAAGKLGKVLDDLKGGQP